MPSAENIIICPFPIVIPVNTIEEGIRLGHFTSYDPFITKATVVLRSVAGEKTIYAVCFNRTIGNRDYLELLRQIKKSFCRYAPNFLLGLMEQVPEDLMPSELRGKHIVAAEPDLPSSCFANESGESSYVYANRRDSVRELLLIGTDEGKAEGEWPENIAFLAEDLTLSGALLSILNP
jgi:hypothetical protein